MDKEKACVDCRHFLDRGIYFAIATGGDQFYCKKVLIFHPVVGNRMTKAWVARQQGYECGPKAELFEGNKSFLSRLFSLIK